MSPPPNSTLSAEGEPYSRDELQSIGDAFPTRGPVCPKCQQHIPQFRDLAPQDEARVRNLICQDRKNAATQELRFFTGCPISWAKLWVTHSGRPDSTCEPSGRPDSTREHWGFDLTREARPEILAVIDDLLSSHAVSSVHYTGYAYEPILRLLHRHLGTSFSVMDMPDRYHTGAAFFWEGDEDYPGPARPDWLEDVPFYQEGFPDSDLLIWDTPWSHAGQLAAIIERRRPTHLLLVDEACSATHTAYSWALFPTYALGTLNIRNA